MTFPSPEREHTVKFSPGDIVCAGGDVSWTGTPHAALYTSLEYILKGVGGPGRSMHINEIAIVLDAPCSYFFCGAHEFFLPVRRCIYKILSDKCWWAFEDDLKRIA